MFAMTKHLVVTFASLLALLGVVNAYADVARMEIPQLLEILDRDDVVVIDTRPVHQWKKQRIKGAIHFDTDFSANPDRYDKATTLVLYCA